ncbi:hypothetical protein HDU91_007021 [Kappamyces sp. JEL0680]|nr:hypothetical protein HDU91_007021 [Kappamyces sp. JEL0680]
MTIYQASAVTTASQGSRLESAPAGQEGNSILIPDLVRLDQHSQIVLESREKKLDWLKALDDWEYWTRFVRKNRQEAAVTEKGLTNWDWHPFKPCIALVHSQTALFLYSFLSNAWMPGSLAGLTHPLQKNVSCLSWNPYAPTMLAVGCATGVLLWTFHYDKNLTETVVGGAVPLFTESPSTHPKPQVQPLLVDGFDAVSCLAWSPCGRWLVAGSKELGTICVWDTVDWSFTLLSRGLFAAGKGTRSLVFSHCGSWLLQSISANADSGPGIIVWETHTWKMSRLVTRSECTSITWLPNSRIFFFTLQDSKKLHMLQMKSQAPELDTTNAPSLDIPALEPSVSSGTPDGYITSVSFDPTGSRLAITYKDWPMVGLYRVSLRPLPEIAPIGWISGGAESLPPQDGLALPLVRWARKSARSDALVGIAWSRSRFTQIPCYF